MSLCHPEQQCRCPRKCSLSFPVPSLPASSLAQTGPAGSAVPVPFSRLSPAQGGTGSQQLRAAECHCCSSSWECSQLAAPGGIPAMPALGLCPCHRRALVSLGWRRSLLGILQEAKARGGSPSSCFRKVPSPAGKWWHLSVGAQMPGPSGALFIWGK